MQDKKERQIRIEKGQRRDRKSRKIFMLAPGKKDFLKRFFKLFAKGVFAVSVLFCLGGLLLAAVYVHAPLTSFLDQMERIKAGQYHFIVQAPFVLRPGVDLESVRFTDYLDRGGFQRSDSRHINPGQYYYDTQVFVLATQKNQGLRASLHQGKVMALQSMTQLAPLESYALPQGVATAFLHSLWEQRKVMRYEEFPHALIQGVLATEDRKFFSHWGLDPFGLIRACLVNVKKGEIAQGGSTITQQLVKILLQRRERSYQKKIEEMIIALVAEIRFTKEEILAAYLNNVYLGQVGRFEIRGMAMAANLLVGKDLHQCGLTDYALLAGLIRSPNSASPANNPLAAAARTRTVIKQMGGVDNFAVTGNIVRSYHRSVTPIERVRAAAFYFDRLEQELKEKRLLPGPSSPPLRIEVGYDSIIQEEISALLDQHLIEIEQKKGMKKGTLQGAVVALRPQDGSIVALAGGRNYQQSPFNRASNVRRQIGSLVKPFGYLVSLGGTGFRAEMTQASLVRDSKIRIDFDNISWKPKNYDGKYMGAMTIREAIALSRNIPAVRVGLQGGLDRIGDLLQDLAITPSPDRRPSLLLGAAESNPEAVAGAYGAIANGGKKTETGVVSKVWANGEIIWQRPRPKQVLSPRGVLS